MKRLYVWLVSRLLRALCSHCLRRGRYVDYVHQGRFYLRRYAVFGWLTGDDRPSQRKTFESVWRFRLWTWYRRLRSYLPNLYVHQIVNPDLDTYLHDHPRPWGVSWIALGGYTEHRRHTDGRELDHEICKHKAPALNVLSGNTFHRIADTTGVRDSLGKGWSGGVWTIFLAGPRARAKMWGYLVPGRGYVSHSERHQEFGGEEKRGVPINV